MDTNDHIGVPGTTRSSSKFAITRDFHSQGSNTGSDEYDRFPWIDKKLSIIYFDVPGRAESLRMTAVISNVSIQYYILQLAVIAFL